MAAYALQNMNMRKTTSAQHPAPSSASPSINLTRVLFRSLSSRNRLTSISAISIWQTLDITVTIRKMCARRLVLVLASIYLFTTGFYHRSCLFLVAVNVDDVDENWKSIKKLPGKKPTKTGVFLLCVEMNFNHNIQQYRERMEAHTHTDTFMYLLPIVCTHHITGVKFCWLYKLMTTSGSSFLACVCEDVDECARGRR